MQSQAINDTPNVALGCSVSSIPIKPMLWRSCATSSGAHIPPLSLVPEPLYSNISMSCYSAVALNASSLYTDATNNNINDGTSTSNIKINHHEQVGPNDAIHLAHISSRFQSSEDDELTARISMAATNNSTCRPKRGRPRNTSTSMKSKIPTFAMDLHGNTVRSKELASLRQDDQPVEMRKDETIPCLQNGTHPPSDCSSPCPGPIATRSKGWSIWRINFVHRLLDYFLEVCRLGRWAMSRIGQRKLML